MWEFLLDVTFDIINFFYSFVGDWGMAIIIVTVIFRACLAPLMSKQIKSSYHMQKLQPLMQEIQTKYKDDPVRMNEEMQKLYAEGHFNPLAGCLPMLLQMPIFMLLFQVLRTMGDRIQGSSYEFYHLVPNLTESPSAAIASGFVHFLPYLILMIIFAGATFLPMVLQQRNTEGPQKTQMIIMAVVMSVMFLWIAWGSPAGVLLYWGTSTLIGIAQQQLTMRHLRKLDEQKAAETIDIEPVKVEVMRKAKKKRPTKKH